MNQEIKNRLDEGFKICNKMYFNLIDMIPFLENYVPDASTLDICLFLEKEYIKKMIDHL